MDKPFISLHAMLTVGNECWSGEGWFWMPVGSDQWRSLRELVVDEILDFWKLLSVEEGSFHVEVSCVCVMADPKTAAKIETKIPVTFSEEDQSVFAWLPVATCRYTIAGDN